MTREERERWREKAMGAPLWGKPFLALIADLEAAEKRAEAAEGERDRLLRTVAALWRGRIPGFVPNDDTIQDVAVAYAAEDAAQRARRELGEAK
jgi:hypothetical protein